MMSDRRYISVARFNDSCDERGKIVMIKSVMAEPGDFIRFRHILLD
jgi:hypothetical protein